MELERAPEARAPLGVRARQVEREDLCTNQSVSWVPPSWRRVDLCAGSDRVRPRRHGVHLRRRDAAVPRGAGHERVDGRRVGGVDGPPRGAVDEDAARLRVAPDLRVSTSLRHSDDGTAAATGSRTHPRRQREGRPMALSRKHRATTGPSRQREGALGRRKKTSSPLWASARPKSRVVGAPASSPSRSRTCSL